MNTTYTRNRTNGRKTQSIVFLVSLLAVLVLAACQPIAPEVVAGPDTEVEETISDTVLLHPFGDMATDIEGTQSSLIRGEEGLEITIETQGLAPNEAYTIWWVVFNYPEFCAEEVCAASDLENPETTSMVAYATGAISDESGNARFEATLPLNDASNALDNESGFPKMLMEPAPGLLKPFGAEIHAVVRSHGEALDDPQEQLTTFGGGCNPECANRQAAAHMPGRN